MVVNIMKQARRAFLLEPSAEPTSTAQAFLRHARFRLSEDYAVKISGALAELTEDQIWWRPNEASNSIGNLILHLCGNIRQWMIAGVGGAERRDLTYDPSSGSSTTTSYPTTL